MNTQKGANRQKKEKIVAELKEKVEKSQALVFTNYEGMTHKQIETLKKALKKADAELVIAKNTLIKLALDQSQNSKVKTQNPELEAPTATIFAFKDTILPLKEIAKMIKELKLPIIKSGIFDGKLMSDKEVEKLSTLPSKEVLLTQVVYGLKSPIIGLHRALNWNLQKLVLTLNAIEKTKS